MGGCNKAACQVTRHGRLGWFLSEVLGPENVELAPHQLQPRSAELSPTPGSRNILQLTPSSAFCCRTANHVTGIARDRSGQMYVDGNRRQVPESVGLSWKCDTIKRVCDAKDDSTVAFGASIVDFGGLR
jgi:hypothetical protein